MTLIVYTSVWEPKKAVRVRVSKAFPNEQKKSTQNKLFPCHSKINSCPYETSKSLKNLQKNCPHYEVWQND